MNKKGFTLVELLVAIGILSVLVLFAVPKVLKTFSNARKQSFLNEAKVVFRESNKKFIADSFVDAATNSFDSKNNKLSINAGELDYCVKLNNNGKIKRIGVGNDSYHILYETIDGIDDMKIEYVQKGRLTDELCDNIKNGVITLTADNGKVRNDNEYHSSIKIKNNDSHNVELLANAGYKFDNTTCEDIIEIKSEKLLSITPQNNDIECMVKFTEDTYEVTFDVNQGETESEPNKGYYYYNHGWYSDINHENELTKLINVPTKVGYTFSNYSIDGTNVVLQDGTLESSNKITKSQTLYANFTANNYTVTYNSNTGSGTMNPSSHTYGVSSSLSANKFTKTGYTFAGWATSSAGNVAYNDKESISNLSSEPNSSVILYAKWTPITYTVKYNANGGSGTMNSSTHTYDATKALSANTFTMTGYAFDGWATSSSGNVEYHDKANVKNILVSGTSVTLYAKWKSKALTCEDLNNKVKCSNLNATNPILTYTGNCSYECTDSANGVWKIKYLTSGDLTIKTELKADLFLVGGGGGGGRNYQINGWDNRTIPGAGGGGGYTSYYKNQTLPATTIHINIGNGGAMASAGGTTYVKDESTYSALGGKPGGAAVSGAGGAGGSGGGGGPCFLTHTYGALGTSSFGSPGKFGGNGGNAGSGNGNGWSCYSGSGGRGGQGQGKTTCEFEEGSLSSCYDGVISYSMGGSDGVAVTANTGNGATAQKTGASGVVIMRGVGKNTQIEIAGTLVGTYDGKVSISDTSTNWKINFLTSGTLKLTSSINADIFLVGGGGGGGSSINETWWYGEPVPSGGGGGGYTKTYLKQTISPGTYTVNVGEGGTLGKSGADSYFIDKNRYIAAGGKGATYSGGNGGSGGGGGGCLRYGAYYETHYVYSNASGGKNGLNGNALKNRIIDERGNSWECNTPPGTGGIGQGTTTCEFGEGTTSDCNSGVKRYSDGGNGSQDVMNSGNGGSSNASGNNGIIILRKAK